MLVAAEPFLGCAAASGRTAPNSVTLMTSAVFSAMARSRFEVKKPLDNPAATRKLASKPWQFGVFRLKVMYRTQPEFEAMKSASAVDLPSDLREKRRKFVDLISDRVHVPTALKPPAKHLNLTVAGKEASWRAQYNLPHSSYRESKGRRRTNRASSRASLYLTFKS